MSAKPHVFLLLFSVADLKMHMVNLKACAEEVCALICITLFCAGIYALALMVGGQ